MLNAYCERAGDPAFWAEPFNALTNLAFLVAAGLALYDARRRRLPAAGCWYVYFLVAVIFLIGLGSGAWHSVPTGWTLAADVLPITVFIHVYLAAFLARVVGLNVWLSVAIVAAFFAAGLAVDWLTPRGTLNGSVGYLPAWSAVLAMTIVLHIRAHPLRRDLAIVLAVWTVSLVLRTIDRDICSVLSFGTHPFWHLLNALVLYLLMSILIRNELVRART